MKKMMSTMAMAAFAFGCTCGVQANAAVETGQEAPDFTVVDIEGNEHSLSDFRGKYVVLEWVNYGCPFVNKFYSVGEMQRLQEEYTEQGVIWLTICSSRVGQQGYMTPEAARATNQEKGTKQTAYIYDPSGEVGRLYGAQVTPHMYVINPEGVLIYQGAIDSDRSANPANTAGAENYVVSALTQAKAGEEVSTPSTRPYGCGVKY